MNCSKEDCEFDSQDIDLSQLERTSNGSSGTHTTSYTYEGEIKCNHCDATKEVTVYTNEFDDTGEILSQEIR